MAIKTALVSVTNAATALATPQGITSAAVGNTGTATVTVYVPVGGVTVYVGGSDVTASGALQGLPVLAGASFSVDLALDDVLYGIVASGTQNVNVLNAMTIER